VLLWRKPRNTTNVCIKPLAKGVLCLYSKYGPVTALTPKTLEYNFTGPIKNKNMRYTWVSLAILAIWICTLLLMVSNRLSSPDSFFLFVMITTIALSYIGFHSP